VIGLVVVAQRSTSPVRRAVPDNQDLRGLPPVSNDVGPTYRDIGWTP